MQRPDACACVYFMVPTETYTCLAKTRVGDGLVVCAPWHLSARKHAITGAREQRARVIVPEPTRSVVKPGV